MMSLAMTSSGSFWTWLPSMLAVLAAIGAGICLVIVVRQATGMTRPRENAESAITEANAAADRLNAARGLAENLFSSLRILSSQFDRQGRQFERLLKASDEKIRVMMELNEASASDQPRVVSPLEMDLQPAGTASGTIEPKFDRSHRYGPRHTSPDPLTQAIYDLRDTGKAPVEIARELNEGVGKVELILALRQ